MTIGGIVFLSVWALIVTFYMIKNRQGFEGLLGVGFVFCLFYLVNKRLIHWEL